MTSMEQFVEKDGKRLRLGYTTGSCAAAAAKAAAWMLLTGREKSTVTLDTPKGIRLELPVQDIRREENAVSCAIQKDGGDDPDITNGTLIYASVTPTATPGIAIDGGQGIGRVTKRGLDQPVGNAAINSVPRKMIAENVQEVCDLCDYRGGISVIISAPEGEMLAKKTFNPRLGIVGGISILGTTGIVEPMSEEALVQTIHVELNQKRTVGNYVLLTPGNYGAEFIRGEMGLDMNLAVQTSNFIGSSIDYCRTLGFSGALLIGHIGKLVKLAGGMMNTHSKYGDCRMDILAAHAGMAGCRPARIAEIMDCAACDDAVRILKEEGLDKAALKTMTDKVLFHLQHRAEDMEIGVVIFSKEYGILGESDNARTLLQKILEQ